MDVGILDPRVNHNLSYQVHESIRVLPTCNGSSIARISNTGGGTLTITLRLAGLPKVTDGVLH